MKAMEQALAIMNERFGKESEPVSYTHLRRKSTFPQLKSD